MAARVGRGARRQTAAENPCVDRTFYHWRCCHVHDPREGRIQHQGQGNLWPGVDLAELARRISKRAERSAARLIARMLTREEVILLKCHRFLLGLSFSAAHNRPVKQAPHKPSHALVETLSGVPFANWARP